MSNGQPKQKIRKILVELRGDQVDWLEQYKSREFIVGDAPAIRKLALERLEQLEREVAQQEQERQAVAS
jgi:hypothetical protein